MYLYLCNDLYLHNDKYVMYFQSGEQTKNSTTSMWGKNCTELFFE